MEPPATTAALTGTEPFFALHPTARSRGWLRSTISIVDIFVADNLCGHVMALCMAQRISEECFPEPYSKSRPTVFSRRWPHSTSSMGLCLTPGWLRQSTEGFTGQPPVAGSMIGGRYFELLPT